MLTLRRDKIFGSSATHKKVLDHSILADIVTRSISRIAVKTKEYEFNLWSYHDVIAVVVIPSVVYSPLISGVLTAPQILRIG